MEMVITKYKYLLNDKGVWDKVEGVWSNVAVSVSNNIRPLTSRQIGEKLCINMPVSDVGKMVYKVTTFVGGNE